MGAAAVSVFLTCGCQGLLPDRESTISISFEKHSYAATKAVIQDLPDSGDFILTVTGANGESLYHGAYGKSPEDLFVKPGSYTVELRSCEFSTPKFNTPQYGDSQVVVAKAGQKVGIVLNCTQLNSGVKLSIPPAFLTTYPKGVLFLNSDKGKVMYSYTEKRFAFFQPGKVTLVMDEDGKESILFTRELEPREMLTLGLTIPGDNATGPENSLSIQMDTTRNWTYEEVGIGDKGSGKEGETAENAISVTMAKERIGAKEVWVYGYIVAGDLTASGADFEGPFTLKTAIAIAPRASVNEKSKCMSIQLGSGKVRDALNLVDNPEILGRKLYVKGDIVESYYGIPGIKNIKEFKL